MDKSKILRLCNEIEDIATEIQERTMKDSYFMAQTIINKVLVIAAEVNEPPKTNADRIRQMTDEELAAFIDIYDIEDICKTRCAKTGEARERCMCYGEECKGNIMQWLKQECEENDET